jgi:hypothetical protein
MKPRRSDRVSMSIPVEIAGIDRRGHRFAVLARTCFISRYGASVLLQQKLDPDQKITISHIHRKVKTPARVIGQIGIEIEGQVYAVALMEPRLDFWGVRFPENDSEPIAQVLLECTGCETCKVVPLNDLELAVFKANDRLSLDCQQCKKVTFWKEVPEEQGATERPEKRGATETPDLEKGLENRRKYPRLKIKLVACIRLHNSSDDVVLVMDASKGGIRFRSQKSYLISEWVQVSVPYTPGTANIFTQGRIAWRKAFSETWNEYGLKYIRPATSFD